MSGDFRQFHQWSPPTRQGTVIFPGISLVKAAKSGAARKKPLIVTKDPETGEEHEMGTPGFSEAKKKQEAASAKSRAEAKTTPAKKRSPPRKAKSKKEEPPGWGKPAKAFGRDVPKKKKEEPKKEAAPAKSKAPKKIKKIAKPATEKKEEPKKEAAPAKPKAPKKIKKIAKPAAKKKTAVEEKPEKLKLHPEETSHIAATRKRTTVGEEHMAGRQEAARMMAAGPTGAAKVLAEKPAKRVSGPETAAPGRTAQAMGMMAAKKPSAAPTKPIEAPPSSAPKKPSAGEKMKEKFHSVLAEGPKLLGAGTPEAPAPHVPGVMSHPTTGAVTGSHAAAKPAAPAAMPDEFAARHWDIPKSLAVLKSILEMIEKARPGRATPKMGMGRSKPGRAAVTARPKTTAPKPVAAPKPGRGAGRAAPVGGMGRVAPARPPAAGVTTPSPEAARPATLGAGGTRERLKVTPAAAAPPKTTVAPAPEGATTLAPAKAGGEAVAKPVAETLDAAGDKGKKGKEKGPQQMALPGSAAAEGAFVGSALAPKQVVGGGAEIAQIGPMYAGGKLDIASAGVRVPTPPGGAQQQGFGGKPGTTMTPGVPTGQPSVRRQRGQAGVGQSSMKSMPVLVLSVPR
jgi:hypothetical protein